MVKINLRLNDELQCEILWKLPSSTHNYPFQFLRKSNRISQAVKRKQSLPDRKIITILWASQMIFQSKGSLNRKTLKLSTKSIFYLSWLLCRLWKHRLFKEGWLRGVSLKVTLNKEIRITLAGNQVNLQWCNKLYETVTIHSAIGIIPGLWKRLGKA